MGKMLIYTSSNSNRLEYILELLLQNYLHIDYSITSDFSHFESQTHVPRLNYSQKTTTAPTLLPSKLLFESDIHSWAFQFDIWQGLPTFFNNSKAAKTLPFDLFSAAFYLISRYEEYLPFNADQHGRFTSDQSLSHQQKILHLPIIELWAMAFAKWFKSFYPQFSYQLPKYQFTPTYDIDFAWSYLHKPILRQVGAIGKELAKGQWKRLLERAKVQLQLQRDPFDVYNQLQEWHTANNLHSKYFFLLGDLSSFDKNIPPSNKAFQNLIQAIASQNQIGIHPSYLSNTNKDQLKKEIQRLKNITSKEVTTSRQHFLKLQFPTTYQRLIQLGIQEDYSMGYADNIGFRAGTARAFNWFDLTANEKTNLKVFPFQLMDVTLRQYLGLQPNQAKEHIQPIIKQCKQVGGTFIPLWHNSSFSELDGWEGWKELYEWLLEEAK